MAGKNCSRGCKWSSHTSGGDNFGRQWRRHSTGPVTKCSKYSRLHHTHFCKYSRFFANGQLCDCRIGRVGFCTLPCTKPHTQFYHYWYVNNVCFTGRSNGILFWVAQELEPHSFWTNEQADGGARKKGKMGLSTSCDFLITSTMLEVIL